LTVNFVAPDGLPLGANTGKRFNIGALRSMKLPQTHWHISCSIQAPQRPEAITTAVEKIHPDPEANAGFPEPAVPSAPQRFVAFFQSPAHGQKSARFIAGTALIAGSFLVYLAYPVIFLFLPLSGSVKVAATVAVWILSWAAFSAGIFLTGPQGYDWVKGLWTRVTDGPSRKRAG
jgi:hypothetical protein